MSKMSKKEINRHKLSEAECIIFNSKNPVGTEVLLKKDFVDEPFRTKTRSAAYVSCSGDAVIFVENVTGSYLLDRVTPIEKG